MTVKEVVWGSLLLSALGSVTYAGRDMDYVDGLVARNYFQLAIEHLEEMRGRADVPEEDKVLIPLRLGTIYNSLALVETNAETRDGYLRDASRYLEDFSKKNPTHPRLLDVSLQQVDILSGRAQASESLYRNETDAKKKEEIRKETEELYKRGLAAAQVIVTEAGKKAQDLRPKASTSKTLMDQYWTYFGAELRGMFLLGQQEYLWAQLYAAGDAERKKHLDAALKQFDDLLKQRPKTNVTYDAHVRRGMCLGELAVFEKAPADAEKKRRDAMSAFESALTVQSTPQTISTRAEAYYQKAVTAYALGDYEAAVSAAEGFLREYPQGKNSYRGQEGLLMRARSLGKLAEGQFRRKEVGWEDTYADATRAVKDILPEYPTVREAADRLVQEWGGIFPRGEVVLSPLIAAAQAKKFYQDGNLEEAVAKYREALTLSSRSREYDEFAQEAWKTIGKIYYDTGRLYMAAIAWKELLDRFPGTYKGEELAWVRTRIFAYIYSQSTEKDDFDLNEYMDSLRYFIEKFPKDARVFEAQTESAKVYAIRGDLARSAEIWSKADPANPRFAESMTNSGELYRQAFMKLAEKKETDTPEARQYLGACLKNLRLAADAKLPGDAAENYNAAALARLAEVLSDEAVPQPESARQVPALVEEFRRRFPDDKELTPKVLFAGAHACVILKRPNDAEVLALTLEKEFPGSFAYDAVKGLMVVAFQKADPVKSIAWGQKQFRGNYAEADDAALVVQGNRAWQQKQYDVAIGCFTELEKRYRTKDPEKHREYEESLAAVCFEAGKFAEAIPFYRRFLEDARKNFKTSNTVEDRNRLLLVMRRLAESEEMGGDPKTAVALWNEFSAMVFQENPPAEWFEARYHLANAYANMNEYKTASNILKRVEVLYGGFGSDRELKRRVEELKKKTG